MSDPQTRNVGYASQGSVYTVLVLAIFAIGLSKVYRKLRGWI